MFGLRALGSGVWDPSPVLLVLGPELRASCSRLSLFGNRLSAFGYRLCDLGSWLSDFSSGIGALALLGFSV